MPRIFIPANPGYKTRTELDEPWADVIAWEIDTDDRGAYPVTLWGLFRRSEGGFYTLSPSGEEEWTVA